MFLTVIVDPPFDTQNYSARIVRAAISVHCVLFFALMLQTGRCGVSPLEGAARNKVRARGRLPPLIKPKANERA